MNKRADAAFLSTSSILWYIYIILETAFSLAFSQPAYYSDLQNGPGGRNLQQQKRNVTRMISLILAEKIFSLFLIMFMGYAVVHWGLLHAEDSKTLSLISLYLISPCVIISAFQVQYTPDVLHGLLLALAAAVEQGSSHPLAQAIVREAQRRQLSIPLASGQRALAGSGIEAEVNGSRILICAASKAAPAEHEAQIQQLESAGQTVVLVMRGETLLGILALRDTLRDDARQAVNALHQLGVQGVILTGDNPRAAAAIASELGLEFRAGLLPADKVNAVIALNADAPLAMVGDGINDAPAMKAATIGIAMGSGTDVALETADAALTHNRLTGLAQMISLARATHANIRQNIAIALGLKGIFLVTTLLGLTGLWLAVLADTGATVLVTANALRLLRKKL